MGRNRGAVPGWYWFVKDWLGDQAVQSCGYAAQGLWFEFLNRMYYRTPQGVLPGNLETVARLKGLRDGVASAWAVDILPLVKELEDAHVFSRGKDVPGGLDPDAIVNRRMYRDWLKSANSRAAAQKRWGVGRDAKPDAKPNADCDAECGGEGDAERDAGLDAAVMQGGGVVTVGGSGGCDNVSEVLGVGGAMPAGMQGGMPKSRISNSISISSPTSQSSIDQPSDSKAKRSEGTGSRSPDQDGVERAGKVAQRLLAQNWVTQLVALTGDSAYRKAGWMERVLRIAGNPELIPAMEDLFERLEKDTNPRLAKARGSDWIEFPAGFATDTLMRLDPAGPLKSTKNADKAAGGQG